MYTPPQICLLAALAAISVATVTLNPVPTTLDAGSEVEVSWSIDERRTLRLILTRHNDAGDGWRLEDEVFRDRTQDAGNGTWQWKVPNLSNEHQYILSLWGEDFADESNGVADDSNWFVIQGGHSPNGGLSKGVIAGAAVGSVLGVCAVVVGVWFCLRSLKRNWGSLRCEGCVKGGHHREEAFPEAETARGSMETLSVDSIQEIKEKAEME